MKTLNIKQPLYGNCDACRKEFDDIPLVKLDGLLYCKECAKIVAAQIKTIEIGDQTSLLIELSLTDDLGSIVDAANKARAIIHDQKYLYLPQKQRQALISFARELYAEMSKIDKKKLFSVTERDYYNAELKKKQKQSDASKKAAEKKGKPGRPKRDPVDLLKSMGFTGLDELMKEQKGKMK